MKVSAGAVRLIWLVECSTSGLKQGTPVLSGQSKKSPQQLIRCLAPKRQEFNLSTNTIEIEFGYSIAASAALSGGC